MFSVLFDQERVQEDKVRIAFGNHKDPELDNFEL